MVILAPPIAFYMMASLSSARSPIHGLHGNALESIVDGKSHTHMTDTSIHYALVLSIRGCQLLSWGGIGMLPTTRHLGLILGFSQPLG